jgi:hypothetical protein
MFTVLFVFLTNWDFSTSLILLSITWLHSSLIVLLITSRHEPHRKHRSSVTGYGPLPSCLFCGHCLAMGLHATVYIDAVIFGIQ